MGMNKQLVVVLTVWIWILCFVSNAVAGKTRIVGGDEVDPPFSYPWMVSLQVSDKHRCGGVLIGRDLVLTAAHCVNGERMEILLGAHNLADEDENPGGRERIPVESYVRHEGFSFPNLPDDIAILRLSHSIPDSLSLLPLISDSSLDSEGTISKAIGWGRTGDYTTLSDRLMEVDIPIVSNETCNSAQRLYVTEGMLCAGSSVLLKKGTCYGDSGGPLLVKSPALDDRWEIAGIASWLESCETPEKYSVFTRVSHYLPWIESQKSQNSVQAIVTSQTSKSVCPGSTTKVVMGVKIDTQGVYPPILSATRFEFNTNGSTDPSGDISNAALYYSYSQPQLEWVVDDNKFGSDVSAVNGSFFFEGKRELSIGPNYFWLVFDINPGATLGNVIDSECVSITIGEEIYPATPATNGYLFIDQNLWKEVDMPGFQSFAVDPVNSSIHYAGKRYYGLFKSTDSGNSWSETASQLSRKRIEVIAINPLTTSTLYVGTLTSGVYKSTDGAVIWRDVNEGLPDERIAALCIDPNSPDTVFAGLGKSGVYKSINGGTSWTPMNNGLIIANVADLIIDPVNPSNLFVLVHELEWKNSHYGNRLFKSINGAGSWTEISTGFEDDIRYIAIDPVKPNILYAGTKESGMFISTNSGDDWKEINNGLTDLTVNAFGINADPFVTLYMGTAKEGFYKSVNRGESWTSIDCGFNSRPFVNFGLSRDALFVNIFGSALKYVFPNESPLTEVISTLRILSGMDATVDMGRGDANGNNRIDLADPVIILRAISEWGNR